MRLRTTFIMAVLTATCSIATTAAKPLKIYVLAGQSNMEGQGAIKTFDYIGDDPTTAPLLREIRGPDGKARVCENVWISYLTGSPDRGALGEGAGKLTAGYGARSNAAEDGGKIGPEFTFGIAMEKAYDGPILIIKTAWGEEPAHGFSPAQRRALPAERVSEEAVLRAQGTRRAKGSRKMAD